MSNEHGINPEHGHESDDIQEVIVVVVELVDIEVCSARGETPPKARQYKFRVDDNYFTTDKSELTGREILAFDAKTPESSHLRERLRHGRVVTVQADDLVNLRAPGIERFTTIPCENTDGGGTHVR